MTIVGIICRELRHCPVAAALCVAACAVAAAASTLGIHTLRSESLRFEEEAGRQQAITRERREALRRDAGSPMSLANLRVLHEAEAAMAAEYRGVVLLRAQRTRWTVTVNAVLFLICGGCVGVLALRDSQIRAGEVGIWWALGLSTQRLQGLLMGKWATLAATGAVVGATATATAVGIDYGVVLPVLGGTTIFATAIVLPTVRRLTIPDPVDIIRSLN